MKTFTKSILTTAALALTVTAASAVSVTATLTADNNYALFYGTETAATTFVGASDSWGSTETYTFDLPANNYVYVVTWSDAGTAQGLLGQFSAGGPQMYTQDPAWTVSATGLGNTGAGAPDSGGASDLGLLTAQILRSNANGTPSGGWVASTEGGTNGSAPWGALAGIDAAAAWSWYNSNGSANPTLGGTDHQEWLIFRAAASAIPAVPELSTYAMFALGLVGIALTTRRRKG